MKEETKETLKWVGINVLLIAALVLILMLFSRSLETEYTQCAKVEFDDVLGCSGYYIDWHSKSFWGVDRNWIKRTYYFYTGNSIETFVCSYGKGDDYQIDLNKDGHTELICNNYSHDGSQHWLCVYTVKDGKLYNGYPDPARWRMEGHQCPVGENLYTEFDPLLWETTLMNPDTGLGYSTADINIFTFTEICDLPASSKEVYEPVYEPLPRSIH